MAALHRYRVRMQYDRVVQMDALNDQHAKQLAAEDTELAGDVDVVVASQAVLVQSNVGTDGGQPLHRFDVTVRARRNIVLDATDQLNARFWAEQDIEGFGGASNIQSQQVVLMQENTGSTE